MKVTSCPALKSKQIMYLLVMISEAAPTEAEDYYYAKGNPLYQQNTLQAFHIRRCGC